MRKRGSTDSIRDSVPSSWRALHMPVSLRHVDGTFTNTRGQSLSYLALFPPEKTPLRGVVVFIHSFSVHARRYFHVFERLCEHGFGTVAYDLLGHGESESGRHGVRAHAEKFRYFVDDTNAFLAFTKRQILPQMLTETVDDRGTVSTADTHDIESQEDQSLPSSTPQRQQTTHSAPLPLILMASSYGTLIALHTLLSEQHAFAGVVLVSPVVMVEWRPLLRVQALVVRPLSKLLPKVRGVPAAKHELLCRDPAFLEDYYNDPLTVPDGMTLRMAAQSLKACQALQREMQLDDPRSAVCAVPVLFLLGSADKVTSVTLATRFFSRMRSADKELKVFDGMYHALFDDPERDEVFAHMIQWLETRFPECAPPYCAQQEAGATAADSEAPRIRRAEPQGRGSGGSADSSAA